MAAPDLLDAPEARPGGRAGERPAERADVRQLGPSVLGTLEEQ
jgi:hypothetical protein